MKCSQKQHPGQQCSLMRERNQIKPCISLFVIKSTYVMKFNPTLEILTIYKILFSMFLFCKPSITFCSQIMSLILSEIARSRTCFIVTCFPFIKIYFHFFHAHHVVSGNQVTLCGFICCRNSIFCRCEYGAEHIVFHCIGKDLGSIPCSRHLLRIM